MSKNFIVFFNIVNKFFPNFVEYCSRYTLNRQLVTTTNFHSDNTIIAEILEGRETTLRRIYPLYAAEFKVWVRRFVSCSEADATDAYQEALVALYRNIVSGRLTNLTSSLKTYIFAIGYRQLKRSMRQQHKIAFIAEPSEADLPQDPTFLQILIEDEDYQAQKTHVGHALEQLSPACQKVLELYFYQGYSIPQIKEQLNYQSENSVSVQKSRCLKSLKEILEKY
jgi:RNA polymerase sigma factor (sigma-70 family)